MILISITTNIYLNLIDHFNNKIYILLLNNELN